MNTLLIVGIAVVLVAGAAIGLVLWSQGRDSDRGKDSWNAEDEDGNALSLSSLRIVTSGDENGCYYSWEIVATEPGTAKVTVTVQPTHSSREKVYRKRVGGNLLRDIQAIVDAHGMTAWDDLPPTDLIALDAPSTDVRFVSDGVEHRFGTGDELPRGGWAAVSDIKALLEDAAGVKK